MHQTEGDRLDNEAHKLEDRIKGLDQDQGKLLNECAKVEDQLINEEKRYRQMDQKLTDLLRHKDSLIVTLDKGMSDLSSLKKAIMELRNEIIEKENRVADLKIEIQKIEDEYADVDEDNARLLDELNNLKDGYNEQIDKNSRLYENVTGAEKDLGSLNAEMNRLRSDIAYMEEKFSRSNTLNADLVAILEELKRAIEELTHQNKLVAPSLT